MPNRNNARYIITTRACRRVEVKFISLSYSYLVRVFMRTFSMYFALFRCMRIDQDRVGETTSMYANRPRPCMRIDQDLVCETTSMYANRLVCETTCMRNDRLPHDLYLPKEDREDRLRQGISSVNRRKLRTNSSDKNTTEVR